VEPQIYPSSAYITEGCENGYDGLYSIEYVDKMIQLCDENDVELVFWVSPFCALDDYMRAYNTMGDYAKEKQVPYFNFCGPELQHQIGFDFATDMIEFSHVNLDGCRKITDFFGQYVTSEYGIPSHAGEPDYAIYDEISANWAATEATIREANW
jgi:hypothetical protein